MRVQRGFGAAVAVACCVGALAGCGSSGRGSAGVLRGTPHQLLADAQNAIRQARGYAFSGSVAQNGTRARVSFSTDARGSVKLAAQLGSRSFDVIIVASRTYAMGNAAFWVQASGQSSAASLAGRWLELPAAEGSSLAGSFGPLDPANLPRCLGENVGTLSFAGTTTVDGRRAIVIHDAGNVPGSAEGDLAVAASGPHLPLRLTGIGSKRPGGTVDICNTGKGATSNSGEVTFSGFGSVPAITAPANAQQLG